MVNKMKEEEIEFIQNKFESYESKDKVKKHFRNKIIFSKRQKNFRSSRRQKIQEKERCLNL